MKNTLKKAWGNSSIIKTLTKIQNNKYRRNLRNHNFTILCSNCIGGVISHKLGEQFNSPTVNLSINNKDFCKLIEHLDYYLNCEVEDNGRNKDNKPTGIIRGNGSDIPDIVITFVHYATFADGKRKWDIRKQRINWHNIYLMMFDTDGVTRDDLQAVENFRCNNKVIFTPNKDFNSPYAYYIPIRGKNKYPPDYYLLRNAFGSTLIDTKFDIVSFINKK